jgi:hypothetical protein
MGGLSVIDTETGYRGDFWVTSATLLDPVRRSRALCSRWLRPARNPSRYISSAMGPGRWLDEVLANDRRKESTCAQWRNERYSERTQRGCSTSWAGRPVKWLLPSTRLGSRPGLRASATPPGGQVPPRGSGGRRPGSRIKVTRGWLALETYRRRRATIWVRLPDRVREYTITLDKARLRETSEIPYEGNQA